ncbi:MAG TPA: glycosyltransferase family 4 protein [Desulfurivibrionaceae bacterium]|nr:glycosyltransferase family 4 protein [Desulfurivibrionaceae bacterium]
MAGWWLILVVLPGSFLLTGLVRRLAMRGALLDIPNQRSSHITPTPRGGGLGIVGAFLMGGIGLAMIAPPGTSGFTILLLFTSLLVAGIGFWDDLRQLSAGRRILVHLLAAGLLVWGLGREGLCGPVTGQLWLSQLFGGLLLVLVVVWALNLFNFMDGIDGLAGGEAVFVAAGGALLLSLGGGSREMLLLLLLASACLGFLVWNWPPARIFMGDVGSGFLGFVLAALALRTAIFRDDLPLAVWLILPGVFLADATFTLLRRMVRRERWYNAHRSHAYQNAAVRFGRHQPVTMAVMAINLFWLLPLSILCVILPGFDVPLTILAYLPLLGLAFKFNAGGAISS